MVELYQIRGLSFHGVGWASLLECLLLEGVMDGFVRREKESQSLRSMYG